MSEKKLKTGKKIFSVPSSEVGSSPMLSVLSFCSGKKKFQKIERDKWRELKRENRGLPSLQEGHSSYGLPETQVFSGLQPEHSCL